jgi:hypothetical protein
MPAPDCLNLHDVFGDRYRVTFDPAAGPRSADPWMYQLRGRLVLRAFGSNPRGHRIREAIRGVLDLNLFAEEQRRESEDARVLMAYRTKVLELLKDCDPENLGMCPE